MPLPDAFPALNSVSSDISTTCVKQHTNMKFNIFSLKLSVLGKMALHAYYPPAIIQLSQTYFQFDVSEKQSCFGGGSS